MAEIMRFLDELEAKRDADYAKETGYQKYCREWNEYVDEYIDYEWR